MADDFLATSKSGPGQTAFGPEQTALLNSRLHKHQDNPEPV
jgi:hypothetical protein